MTAKDEIRKRNKKLRAQLDKNEVLQKSSLASEFFLKSELYKQSEQIMLYMPLGNEISTLDIIKKALDDGKRVVLPVTDGDTGEITPCLIDKNTRFGMGAFSVTEPIEGKTADMDKTDVIIVPGIAYDRNGGRVGFGKGCYDRLLDTSTAVKVGYCYDFQICDEIDTERHDVKMDFLVSESGIIKINKEMKL